MSNIRLYGVTVVYNEQDLVPIVMPYIEKMNYDKLVIWDNGSTDNTVELLEKYPFIEIRHFETPEFVEDEKLKRIVDTIDEFRREKVTDPNEQIWMTMCDFDEVFQYNTTKDAFFSFKEYLWWMGNNGYMVCREHIWNLVEDGTRVQYGTPFYWNKPNLFRLDGISSFSVVWGQHDMNVTYQDEKPAKIFYDTKMISAFHLKFYNLKGYLKRQRLRSERGFIVYNDGKVIPYIDDVNSNIDVYNEIVRLSIPYEEYFTNKILNGREYVGEFLV